MRTRWLKWMGGAGLLLAAGACVVRDTRPVNTGYGYGGGAGYASGGVTVGEPSPHTVTSLPPEPLYEQMTVSPGFGHVWIDGYWHWNSYEWVWVSGRWVREQGTGYVYVQPYYDYADGAYIYMPGYWASRERVPRGWNVRDHRDGRPTVVVAPPGGVRPPPGAAPSIRDHRPPATGAYQPTAPYQPPGARPYQPPAPPPRARPAGAGPGTYQPAAAAPPPPPPPPRAPGAGPYQPATARPPLPPRAR